VLSVAFSPDGSRIVTGDIDQTASVWDARTGAASLELRGLAGPVNGVAFSVAFSPDGTRIVTGRGVFSETQIPRPGEANVWDARTGVLLLELKGHSNLVTSASFSPDGTRILTGSLDRTAKMWDARTGSPQIELKAHLNGATSVAFSPDGARVATGGGESNKRGEVKVWDARTGALLLELKGHTGAVYGVAFSPDGTRILTGSLDRTAKVWDARSGAPLLDLKGHTRGVSSVAFSPDGTQIASGGGWSNEPGEAMVWDARTGALLFDLKGHTRGVWSVAFSPDGTRIVTGSSDQTAKVWDASSGRHVVELKGHTGMVWSAAFSPDATRIVTGAYDQTAKVWDARTGTTILDLLGHGALVMSVAFSPDGTRILTGSWDRTAKVWDARTGTPLFDLKGHTDRIRSVAFSPDGTRIATGAYDGTARVWHARTPTPPIELKGHTVPVLCAAFSPDGMRIVTGNEQMTAKVWDARTGTPLLDLKGHPGGVTSVAFSPDGTRIVCSGWDETVRVWDARKGALQLELKGHETQGLSVRFSPDGTRIITETRDGMAKVRVWDARTGQLLMPEPIPPAPRSSFVSPDGRWIAHPVGNRVQLIPMQPDAEEIAYRLLQTRRDPRRYREEYDRAVAAHGDFAARFYLNLLPRAEQEILKAQAAADREIAAGRTREATTYLAKVSASNPEDTSLFQKVAALQAWFGQEKELADTCRRGLELAENTTVPETAERVAKACCLLPSTGKAQLEGVLALARKAVELGGKTPNLPWFWMAVGMAEYRSGHFAEAEAALIAAAKDVKNNPHVTGTSAFYRALSLFRQGKENEARTLATEATAKMKPLPKDEKNPLAGVANHDDLILWLAYKEAKALLKFDAAPLPEAKPDQK
jgi:WD40 repeat protein